MANPIAKLPLEIRDPMEIQRAHDILVSVLAKQVRVVIEPDTLKHFHVAASTLCWVPKHSHNEQFAKTLAELEAELLDLGYVLTDIAPS